MTLFSCFTVLRINHLRIQNKNPKPILAVTNEALSTTTTLTGVGVSAYDKLG